MASKSNRVRPLTLRDWLVSNAPLELRDAVVAATASRGKRRGRILASVPSGKGDAAVGAWRALMVELAPNRCGGFALLWASDEERDTYRAVQQWLQDEGTALWVVKLAGGAPLEFSLLHMRLKPEGVAALADMVDIDPDALGYDWLVS